MGRGIAQGVRMLEDKELARGHLPPAGRAVVLKHVLQGLPEQGEVCFGKAGSLGQGRGNKAVHPVQGIRDDKFMPHSAVVALLRFGFLFSSDGHAGDGNFARHDRVLTFGKGELYRAAHLPAVDAGAHYRAKASHIVKVFAHPQTGLFNIAGRNFVFCRIKIFCLVCALVLLVQNGLFAYVDIVSGGAALA